MTSSCDASVETTEHRDNNDDMNDCEDDIPLVQRREKLSLSQDDCEDVTTVISSLGTNDM